MKKLLTILMLLALAVPAWAGEQTITISRNDGQFESSSGVYYASKGGVTMSISGGMNNPNFLLLKHENTISFKSANFAIKEIIFHCLDDYPSSNLDVFYWGPTTMNVKTVNLYVNGQSTAVTPGKYTASGYDGHWVSNFSGTWTSEFKGTTRSHTPYANGYPAGNTLTFESMGKPIRFSSIDIVIEKEVGDIFDLVTSDNEIEENQTYVLVSQYANKALSSELVNGPSLGTNGAYTTQTFASTPITFPVADKLKVRTTEEVQLIKLVRPPYYENRPWLLKVANGYIRRRSGTDHRSTAADNRGWNLYKVDNLPTGGSADNDWTYFRVSISVSGNTNSNALIKYYHSSTEEGGSSYEYAIRHRNSSSYFRDIDYSSANTYAANQRVYLYKPADTYNVYTTVMPNNEYGSIALRDGIVVTNGENTSQKFETVSFLVTPANEKKVKSITIIKEGDPSVVIPPEDITTTQTINGTLYSFEMPGYDVRIIAEFTEVEYHNVNIVIDPDQRCGNVFITDGYVVQNDQVKSFEGQNVVFNVISNLINIDDETEGYYELKSVTVTDDITGQSITYNLSDGNYNFTMPNHDVTITATFKQDAPEPLYLLGTANGGYWTYNNGNNWHTYGPVFNYNKNIGYYIDVYYKGTGEFEPGVNSENAYGYFSLSKRYADNEDWNYVNGYRLVAKQSEGGNVDIADGETKTLYADNDNNRGSSFRIPAGIYRIVVDKNMTQVSVTRKNISLNFDPTGGFSINQPEIVSPGTNVSLMGSLYNVIQSVNSNIITPQNTPIYHANHDDANFKYKAVKTIGENSTTDGPTASTTILNTTLNVVNEGETVTKLEGWNYLGWIVANNTGYYKVIDTPLHWIEENGKKDNTYTVSDRLQGVYAQEGHLWCKDLGDDDNKDGISIVKTEPVEGQIDYLAKTLKPEGHRFNNIRIGNWDQSNWVELDFTGLGTQSEAQEMAQALQGHYITAKSVTGVYTDDVNYTIKLKAQPTADGDASYVPNTYSPSNFIESNLMIDGNVGPVLPSNGVTYYFLNPKVQEYAVITYAMWDKPQQIMVIPNNTPFNGAAKIGRWDLNDPNNQLEALDAAYESDETVNNVYEFHIIVQRANKSYGTPAQVASGQKDNANVTPKPGQSTTGVIMAQPLDLLVSSPLPTAINRVGTEAQVVGVEYVNIAGMRSSKPFKGVNIVVTRYSDGSTTTSKVIK